MRAAACYFSQFWNLSRVLHPIARAMTRAQGESQNRNQRPENRAQGPERRDSGSSHASFPCPKSLKFCSTPIHMLHCGPDTKTSMLSLFQSLAMHACIYIFVLNLQPCIPIHQPHSGGVLRSRKPLEPRIVLVAIGLFLLCDDE